jgi:hypothetical protein
MGIFDRCRIEDELDRCSSREPQYPGKNRSNTSRELASKKKKINLPEAVEKLPGNLHPSKGSLLLQIRH